MITPLPQLKVIIPYPSLPVDVARDGALLVLPPQDTDSPFKWWPDDRAAVSSWPCPAPNMPPRQCRRDRMRVVIVEPNAQYRETLCAVLRSAPDVVLIATHQDANAALAETLWEQTDMLITAIHLPGFDGIDLIRKARELTPGLITVIYTMEQNRANIMRAIRAGINGYLHKSEPLPSIKTAILSLAKGGSPISPVIGAIIFDALRQSTPLPPSCDLSPRQALILRMVNDGQIYKQIADSLGVSINTIHTHIRRIYRALNVTKRLDALHVARELGLL